MPELPEVEITRRGLAPHCVGAIVTAVVVRHRGLRYPVADDLEARLAGQPLHAIDRRGKYLIFRFGTGHLILHLGMSGSLREMAADRPAGRHDHLDIVFDATAIRLRDPRRFGAAIWTGDDPRTHPLLARLGIEPLDERFDGGWLHAALRVRRGPIKQVLMDSHLVTGVGNIYASESLYRAGIRPTRGADTLTRPACGRLAAAVRATLEEAIAAGGSSMRDFVHADGGPGGFQLRWAVYGREGEPCRNCGAAIRALRLGQRSTYYCPACQR